MTIWGKFKNLFAPKCAGCRAPLTDRSQETCSVQCENHMAEMQAFSM